MGTPRNVRRRPFIVCDDVRGRYREDIIREHMEWLEGGGADQHEKDFSGAPIERWLSQRDFKTKLRRRRKPLD